MLPASIIIIFPALIWVKNVQYLINKRVILFYYKMGPVD